MGGPALYYRTLLRNFAYCASGAVPEVPELRSGTFSFSITKSHGRGVCESVGFLTTYLEMKQHEIFLSPNRLSSPQQTQQPL